MLQFPTEHEAWKKFVHQELKAQLTDLQRLWKRLPQRPDDPWGLVGGGPGIEIGTFDGTRGTVNTRGTNTGGTNTGGTNTGGTNTAGTTTAQTVQNCGLCTSVPLQYEITVAGITNGSCSTCNNWNGTFTLTKVAGLPCTWRTAGVHSECSLSSETRWQFQKNNLGPNWTLSMVLASWSVGSTFNCLGSTVLTLNSGPSPSCANYPATITIQAV